MPIVIAEPVMKPAIAGTGMNSTIKPSRRIPSPRVMTPQKNASVVAINSGDHWLGYADWTDAMTEAVCNDMTATGPIVTSFDVAKKQ